MVNGSLCNLFALAFLRRHLVCYAVLTRPNQVKTTVHGCNPVSILPYRFLSCWFLAKSTFLRSQISPCSLLNRTLGLEPSSRLYKTGMMPRSLFAQVLEDYGLSPRKRTKTPVLQAKCLLAVNRYSDLF